MKQDRMVRVAVAQMYSEPMEKEKNEKKIFRMIEEAADQRTDLLIFPEYALLGFPRSKSKSTLEKYRNLVEYVPGPFVMRMMEMASKCKVHVYCGIVERASNAPELLFSSGLFVFPNREYVIYRKMHIWNCGRFGEGFLVSKPNEGDFKVVDTVFGRIGLLICYDMWFPETARILALRGAEAVLSSSCQDCSGGLRYQRVVPARAVENQLYVASANQSKNGWYGHSMIADYEGRITLEFNTEEEGIKGTELSFESVRRWRKQISYLRDRRPLLYEAVCRTSEL